MSIILLCNPDESIKHQDLRNHSGANLSLLSADLSANSNCSQLVQLYSCATPDESIKYQDLRSHSEANLSLLSADLSANSNCSQSVQQPVRMVSPD